MHNHEGCTHACVITMYVLKYFVWEASNEKVCFYFHKTRCLENKVLLENIALQSANIAQWITCINNFKS